MAATTPGITVVPAAEKFRAPQASCVDMLERWLAKAKAGEIVAVAIAGADAAGGAHTEYSADRQCVTLLGAVHLVGTRLATRIDANT